MRVFAVVSSGLNATLTPARKVRGFFLGEITALIYASGPITNNAQQVEVLVVFVEKRESEFITSKRSVTSGTAS